MNKYDKYIEALNLLDELASLSCEDYDEAERLQDAYNLLFQLISDLYE